MQDIEAWFTTDAKKAAKVSTPISFEIAKEAGVAITKEGPVAYEAGHYLVLNGLSPAYPVAPAAFGALYDVSPEHQGVATPKAIEKMTKQATQDGSIMTSDSETTKAYICHRKICSARSSNTSSMHGGAYLEDGVGYCTLCDEKL